MVKETRGITRLAMRTKAETDKMANIKHLNFSVYRFVRKPNFREMNSRVPDLQLADVGCSLQSSTESERKPQAQELKFPGRRKAAKASRSRASMLKTEAQGDNVWGLEKWKWRWAAESRRAPNKDRPLVRSIPLNFLHLTWYPKEATVDHTLSDMEWAAEIGQ